jgi:hypothetical protein
VVRFCEHMDYLARIGAAAMTALDFFRNAGRVSMLGDAVSAMIRAFVPKGRLTPCMAGPRVSPAVLFGAASL